MEQEVQQVEVKDNELEFSRCLIALMKGVVEQESQPGLWNSIVNNQARIEEYVQKISLRLYLDKVVGYAYLRQVENENLPRLVNRHQLSFGLSMLLVTLRKSLGDYDAASGDSFYVIKKSDILLKLKGFFPQAANETKYVHEIERYIKRACEMGFLVPVKGERHLDNGAVPNVGNLIHDEAYEVKELIRSFITAAWLKSFEERISDYINYANGEPENEADDSSDEETDDTAQEKPQDITTTLELEDDSPEQAENELIDTAGDEANEQPDDTVINDEKEIAENKIDEASEEDATDGLI